MPPTSSIDEDGQADEQDRGEAAPVPVRSAVDVPVLLDHRLGIVAADALATSARRP